MHDLFKKLFGTWTVDDEQIFRKKLFLSSRYLFDLIKQEKINQVIEFSTKDSHSGGWVNSALNKIFLNPRLKSGVIGLAATLIHEVTHKATCSYDFFSTIYSKNNKEFSISLKNIYALAAKGTAGQLTKEKRLLLEVGQLLKSSDKYPNLFKKDNELFKKDNELFKKELFHREALDSAETQVVTTFALATIPKRYACLGGSNLLIKQKFILFTDVATHTELPAPEKPLTFQLCGEKGYKVRSSALSGEETRPHTADSGISSYAGSGGTDMEWECSPLLSPLLTQEMVSTPPPTVASLALSPEALPPTQARNPSSVVYPANSPKPLGCPPS